MVSEKLERNTFILTLLTSILLQKLLRPLILRQVAMVRKNPEKRLIEIIAVSALWFQEINSIVQRVMLQMLNLQLVR